MAVETLTTPRSNLPNTYTNVNAREIDFVTRFGNSTQALLEILGIMNAVKKENGSKLVSYTASVTLADGNVPAGAVIPYSKQAITEIQHSDLTIEKYAKAVTVEEVSTYGPKIAIQKGDDAFLNELQNKVTDSFYTFVADDTHAITGSYTTWQKTVAMAIGKVRDKFKKMRKNTTNVVVFVNTLDLYKYLGDATISLQSLFGLDYVKNFMGAQTMIVTSEIPEGTVIATPAENLVLYYADPSGFGELGLDYQTDGVTNFIGFHAQGNYNTAVGESYALLGMVLWAEYADGIAVLTVDANPLKGVTVQSESAGTTYDFTDKTPADFQEDVAVSGNKISGKLKFIEGGLSPAGPLAGDGYFLALKWNNPDASATSLTVQLIPSESGMDPVECIDDTDRNGVFKISSPSQRYRMITSNSDHKTIQDFDLSGLVLESEGV